MHVRDDAAHLTQNNGPRDASQDQDDDAYLKHWVGLEMGLLGFQIRPVSAREFADVRRLNGPKPLQHPSKMVGREAPHHFGWVLKRFRAV